MARRLLVASLALVPVTFLLDFVVHSGKVVLFAFAAVSLVPLAWVIGESTEHAAEHTGARIGGLLNASFGNAPELIIALIAIADSLPDVVRGSIAGSIVSNILLVLGAAMLFGPDAQLDLRSLLRQLGLVALAVVLLLIPSIPGWHGNPDRGSLAHLGIAPAVVLLLVYLVMTFVGVRRGERPADDERGEGWSLRRSIVVLALATAATAVTSEILVHSLEAFAHAANLSTFFIAVVIVAIVGNAAEHGGAVVIARRGKMKLATEIAISSSAQVGLFVAPAVALLSFLFAQPLTLAFRPVELGAIAAAAVFVAVVIRDGKATRLEGVVLVCAYAALVVAFFVSGDRGTH